MSTQKVSSILLPDGTTARFRLVGVLESSTKQNGKPYTKLTATWRQDVPEGQPACQFSMFGLLYQDGTIPGTTKPRMRGLETGRKGLSGAWPWADFRAALKGAGWNARTGEGFTATQPVLVKLQLVPANEPYPARNVPTLFSPCQASEDMAAALDALMGGADDAPELPEDESGDMGAE